ncbi:MAG: helix-turn-helix transcriptional regulator [Lachnospiraceae bacterium]|nr:helix-turn-helix transcriptional regulator [Lachnospiraceae bacterium]
MEQKNEEIAAFSTFIRDARIQKKITSRQLSRGICSEGFLSGLENGKRSTDVLTNERLLSRLGIGLGEFYFLVGGREYEQEQGIAKVIKLLYHQKYEEAKKVTENFLEGLRSGEKIARQVGLHLLSMAERNLGASSVRLHEILKEAVGLTMPLKELDHFEELILSIQEVDMLLDYEECSEKPRPEMFLRLAKYALDLRFEETCQAKVFPKAVVLYCQHANISNEDKKDALDDALNLLRRTASAYYLWEILRLRNQLSGNPERKGNYVRWLDDLEEMYSEYGIPIENRESLIVYSHGGFWGIQHVITARWKMLGSTAEELCEDCCSRRTLQRLANGGTMPQGDVLRALFTKLRLPVCTAYGDLLYGDWRGRELYREFTKNYNIHNPAMMSIIRRLSENLTEYSTYNQQIIDRLYNIMAWNLKEKDTEEFRNSTLELLQKTLPIERLQEIEIGYFTWVELLLLTDMVRGYAGDEENVRKYLDIICKQYQAFLAGETWEMVSGHQDFIMNFVCSEYGNIGEYQLSTDYERIFVDGNLRKHNLNYLMEHVYNCWWNEWMQHPESVSDRELHWCYTIAEIIQRDYMLPFLNEKMEILKKRTD